MLPRRWIALTASCAVLLGTSAAFADRVALLPTRGGLDPGARTGLDGDLVKDLAALGHTVVPEAEVAAAVKAKVADGVADTQDEYRAVGDETRADWVLVGTIDPAVATSHVELTACLVKAGRVESVAREVERPKQPAQVQEMLAVLLRPEGIGAGALPWEHGTPAAPAPPPPEAPKPPPAPEPPPVPPVDGKAHVSYPLSTPGDVWPPYSGGNRGFAGVVLGLGIPAARPSGAVGSGASFVFAARGGYAVGDLGAELFGELGGNLSGPRALWVAGGLRWMFAPAMKRGADGVRGGVPFFLGPEILGGAFIELGESSANGTLSTSATGRGMFGASLDLAYALAPSFQLEAGLGNLRLVPGGAGTILLAGATLGASYRF
jgi:hypothetical protein